MRATNTETGYRAFDTGSDRVWDSMNRGVREAARCRWIWLTAATAPVEGHQEAVRRGRRGRRVECAGRRISLQACAHAWRLGDGHCTLECILQLAKRRGQVLITQLRCLREACPRCLPSYLHCAAFHVSACLLACISCVCLLACVHLCVCLLACIRVCIV